jgi:hypothetical protein
MFATNSTPKKETASTEIPCHSYAKRLLNLATVDLGKSGNAPTCSRGDPVLSLRKKTEDAHCCLIADADNGI